MSAHVLALLGAILIALLAGCSSSRGWSLEFGVHPVSAVEDHRSLKEHN